MDTVTAALIAQGPLGIVCVFLLGAVVHLYTNLQASHAARLQEAKEIILTVHESTRALNDQARLIQTAMGLLKP